MNVRKIGNSYAQRNTPYARASALVGVTGIKKVVLMTVEKLTGCKYHLFGTAEQAMDWLVKQ